MLCREWLETLRVVRSMSAEKIKRIMEREVDPRNALGSIDLDNIDQVVAADQTKRCVLGAVDDLYTYLHVAPMPSSLSLLIEFSIYKQSVHLKCIGGLEVYIHLCTL